MLYLATASGPKVRDAMTAGHLCQMITYKSGNRLTPGATFAIDNGVVTLQDGRPVTDPDWDPDRWETCLVRYRYEPRCLFAAVPDVVGDADATNERWAWWHGMVRNLGYRAAYVLQNGCRSIPTSAGAVFIGGDDEFKLGPAARLLVAEAKRRGLWVHGGRVNSLRRLRYMADIGCDSVDGTLLAHGPDVHLPRLRAWLDPDQPGLFGGIA